MMKKKELKKNRRQPGLAYTPPPKTNQITFRRAWAKIQSHLQASSTSAAAAPKLILYAFPTKV